MRNVDVRVSDDYKIEKRDGNISFQISEIFIENIKRQKEEIQHSGRIAKDDYILIDSYFGFFDGSKWSNVKLIGVYKVLNAYAARMTNEIKIDIKPIRVDFESNRLFA